MNFYLFVAVCLMFYVFTCTHGNPLNSTKESYSKFRKRVTLDYAKEMRGSEEHWESEEESGESAETSKETTTEELPVTETIGIKEQSCPEGQFWNSDRCTCTSSGDSRLQRVIWPLDGACYTLSTQGPCELGQWLVFDIKFQTEDEPANFDAEPHLVCRPTNCTTDGFHLELEDSTCVKLDEQGPCPDRHIVIRSNRRPYECYLIDQHNFSVAIAPDNCRPGEAIDVNGNCRKKFG